MTTIEENKRIARLWLDLVSEGRVEEMCDMTAPTWTITGGAPGLPPGPDGLRKLFASFDHAEQKWTVEDVIAEGDKVAIRATNRCRQDSFLGIPGQGIWQTFTSTFIHHIVDGKVLQTWRNADDLGRVLQLGVRLEVTK